MPALKPYPRMKDSGAAVLGVVPEHWGVNRLGQLGGFSKGNGGNKEDAKESGVPCVRYGDLYTSHNFFIETSRSYVSPERANDYTPIQFGDVLFAGSGETINEIGKSAVNLIRSSACCGGDVILFRSNRDVSARFMGYSTDCAPTAIQKARMGRGITVMHIYAAELKNLIVALPPLPEQTAIARFLDHMDRRIQTYIRAKEKLVAMLDEYKQALIHQAVTGQIDVRTGRPYGKYKDSGVEWLRKIPAHWSIRRNGRIFAERNEKRFGRLPILEVSLHTGVRARDMDGGVRKQQIADRDEYKRAAQGDIAYNMMRMWQGAVGVAPVDGLISPAYVVAMPLGGVDARYFEYQFRTTDYRQQINMASRGIVPDRNRLYWHRFKGMPSVAPPSEDQYRISDFLEAQGRITAKEVLRQEQLVHWVKEYREALIGDVVTGKFDVREAAVALPQPDPSEGESTFGGSLNDSTTESTARDSLTTNAVRT